MERGVRMAVGCALLVGAAVTSGVADAQTDIAAGSNTNAAVVAPFVAVDTVVEFEFAEGISSKTAKVGQRVAIRLLAPIYAGSSVAVPSGAMGEGEVIHAARAGAAGKAGELILAARFIASGGERVPLKGFKFSQSGISRIEQAGTVNAAMAGASVFVPLPPVALLISGRNIEVVPGTRGTAKVAADLPWPSTEQ